MMVATTTTVRELRAALAKVKPACATRSSIAVLGCVRIGHGMIEATDMVATIRTPMLAASFDPVLANLAGLSKVLGALKPADDVQLGRSDDADAPGLTLTHRLGTSTLPGEAIADWPETDRDDAEWATLTPADPVGMLAEILAVSVAASGDESRPRLTGTQLRANDAGGVWVAATDSYRMHVSEAEVAGCAPTMLLPDAERYLGKLEGVESIRASVIESKHDGEIVEWARFSDGATSVTLRCLNGASYPDWENLYPTAWKQVVTFDDAREAADVVAYAKKIQARHEPVIVGLDGDDVTFSISVQGGPSHEATVPATCVQGREAMRIGASPGLLLDAFGFVGDDAAFHAISPLRPMMVTNGNRRALVMPTRMPG